MKPNYHAWNVAINDFPSQGTTSDKLIFLLRFAVLAPSGHNTQPWSFSIAGNDISLRVVRERSLEGSDPARRQLLIAFGCFIENLCIAADHYGYTARIRYFPDPQDEDLIAKISFDEKGKDVAVEDGGLIAAIPLRHTNRGRYLARPLPERFLERIKRIKSDHAQIFVIMGEKGKDAIADVVNEAQIEIMDDAGFREELSAFIRSNFTREHTGMPGFALEVPALVSVFASRLIKRVNLSRANKKKDVALLKQHTPGGFIVVTSEKDDAVGRLAAGRLFEKIWLMATAAGLNCSPLAAAIQSKRHNIMLKRILHTELEPQVFFRIGYGEKPFRHSPRFTVEQLLTR